ncbi:MAG: DUF6283 family protein [bacterium]|jgi:hypothetical protein
MSKLPIIKNPCNNCPFRKDALQGWLGEKRMTEILESDSFVCHKTTQGTLKQRKQCAGFMIIKGDESEAVRLSKVLRIDLGLKNKDLIFENKQDCIKHHTKNY